MNEEMKQWIDNASYEGRLGEIIQIDPSVDLFGGCLAVVNGISDSGRVIACVQNAASTGKPAYIFLTRSEYEPTGGRAAWVVS